MKRLIIGAAVCCAILNAGPAVSEPCKHKDAPLLDRGNSGIRDYKHEGAVETGKLPDGVALEIEHKGCGPGWEDIETFRYIVRMVLPKNAKGAPKKINEAKGWAVLAASVMRTAGLCYRASKATAKWCEALGTVRRGEKLRRDGDGWGFEQVPTISRKSVSDGEVEYLTLSVSSSTPRAITLQNHIGVEAALAR